MLIDVLARVEARLAVVGKNASQASREAGLGEDAIRNLQRAVKGSDPGRKGVSTRTIAALAPVLETSTGWLLDGIGDADATTPDIRLVPVISWVAAGRLGNVDLIESAEVERYVSVAELPRGEWFALTVRGHSMDRIAAEGSIIIVNKDDTALVSGKFYVFATRDGEATFKRYKPSPSRYLPCSTFPDEEPIYPKMEEEREWRVIGRVYKVITSI